MNNLSFFISNLSKFFLVDSINKIKPKKHITIPNRLKNIHQEQAREEKTRKEKQELEEKVRKLQEQRKIKEDRINFKLKKFSLTKERQKFFLEEYGKKDLQELTKSFLKKNFLA